MGYKTIHTLTKRIKGRANDNDNSNNCINNNNNIIINNNNYVDGQICYHFYLKLAELLPNIWQFCYLGRFATMIGSFATRLGSFATELGRFATNLFVRWQICYRRK